MTHLVIRAEPPPGIAQYTRLERLPAFRGPLAVVGRIGATVPEESRRAGSLGDECLDNLDRCRKSQPDLRL